jgi:glycosyltransferase involved in cell wall biosynthesis
MKLPTVSVIIPAFNEEKYLGRCLEAFALQDVPADEIIVIDNNSTDNTRKIAEIFKHTQVVCEKKQGMISARNKGFNIATSTILARCDADTIVPSNWIKTIKETFKQEEIDGLSGPAELYDFPIKNGFKYIQRMIYFDTWKLIKKYHVLYGSNMAITRDMWLKIKNDTEKDDKKVHEDQDLSKNIIRVCGKIKFDPYFNCKISSRFYIKRPSKWAQYMRKTLNALMDEE